MAGTDLVVKFTEEFPHLEPSLIAGVIDVCNGKERETRKMLLQASKQSGKSKSRPLGTRHTSSESLLKAQEKRLKAKLEKGETLEAFEQEVEQDQRSILEAVGNMSNVNIINPPREGKKLLVLDMDYTLFDFKSTFGAETDFQRLKRPYLHEFLTAVYKHYDLIVWSQTTWKRLETILTALGLLTSEDFKFVFVLDNTVMYKVTRQKKSRGSHSAKMCVHEVKDLHYVWGKFPEHYNPCNTIHIDDVERNFAMNPANGLLIQQFDATLRRKKTDRTLLDLSKYLLAIRHHDDFTSLKHAHWKEYIENLSSYYSYSESGSGNDGIAEIETEESSASFTLSTSE